MVCFNNLLNRLRHGSAKQHVCQQNTFSQHADDAQPFGFFH